jgi:hypothetical protein
MLAALFRRLRRLRVGLGCWVVFGVLSFCGATLGVWCASFCEYPVGTYFRLAGFPIPVVFFHLEDGVWVDFPVPKFQAFASALTNIIAVIVLATLPLWLVSWRQSRRDCHATK